MATMMLMEWPGITPELYEEAREIVGWERNPPEGGLIHVSRFENDTLYVTDIWDSEQQCTDFVQQRLMPGLAPLNIPTHPTVRFAPIHRTWVPASPEVCR